MLAAAGIVVKKYANLAAASAAYDIPKENVNYYLKTWQEANVAREMASRLLPDYDGLNDADSEIAAHARQAAHRRSDQLDMRQ